MFSSADTTFMETADSFLAATQTLYGQAPDGVQRSLEAPPIPLVPVLLGDPLTAPQDAIDEVAVRFLGPHGVAAFVIEPGLRGGRHRLLDLADRLADRLPTRFAVDHPMEGHPEAVSRFGAPDGTLKIYDLPLPPGSTKYREQAETNEAFEAHNDGLGYAGVIAAAALVCDRPPLWGGFTVFSNVVRSVAALALADPDAFRSLFLPDAITALRPRGKGAIRVTAPVLYLGPGGEPRVFLRVASGEYKISWRQDVPALSRARAWCEALVTPFAAGSSFCHLMTPGEGVLIRNQHVVHSRTPFLDGPVGGRVLARKWFVEQATDAPYRHAPGLVIKAELANLLPDRFGPERVTGDWHYDPASDDNLRMSEASTQ